jgi:hypothetical protein
MASGPSAMRVKSAVGEKALFTPMLCRDLDNDSDVSTLNLGSCTISSAGLDHSCSNSHEVRSHQGDAVTETSSYHTRDWRAVLSSYHTRGWRGCIEFISHQGVEGCIEFISHQGDAVTETSSEHTSYCDEFRSQQNMQRSAPVKTMEDLPQSLLQCTAL